MNKPPAEHDPFQAFQNDAHDIFNARQKALQINRERNIRESGDEIEIPVRQILAKRLSAYVAHGHIVDKRWTLSSQLDFILCDSRLFPVWNRLQSGAEHILYDAVHAIGEIKTSYSRRSSESNIEQFGKIIASLKRDMLRDPSSVHDKLGFLLGPGICMTAQDVDPYLNPMFIFMLIADSTYFQIEQIRGYYSSTPIDLLPNVVCLLDRGCIVRATVRLPVDALRGSSLSGTKAIPEVNVIPEFDAARECPKIEMPAPPEVGVAPDIAAGGWVLLQPSDAARRPGMNLVMLHALMVAFLRRTFLKPCDVSRALMDCGFAYQGQVISVTGTPTGAHFSTDMSVRVEANS